MKPIAILGFGASALAATLIACSLTPGARAHAAAFQVNFEAGSDDNDGLTAASAWKHAPGDPEARGRAARTMLQPGDRVLFAPRVRYRGAIVVSASGSAEAPIVFTSAGPTERAIIDGSDPASGLRPCQSAEDCGGATQWRQLVRFESPIPLSDDSAVFSDGGPLRPSQGPDPKDAFYRDEIDDMLEVDAAAMAEGRVKLPHKLAQGLAPGGGRLALWIQGNRVIYRPILSMDGDIAVFDPTGLKFYTDRPEKAAAIDHVSLIDQPGEYAVLPDQTTVVAMLPPGAHTVSVASGRFGFRLRGASNISIQGLDFENFGDGGKLPPSGIGVYADNNGKPGVRNLRIEANHFRNFVMPQGQGPIIVRKIDDLRIIGNDIDTIVLGSGMRLAGPSTNTWIENNNIRRIGRTGIALLTMDDVIIRRNVVTDIKGVHGNGISPYLDTHNVQVVANTVLDAKLPITFEGAGEKGTGRNNILFANNLVVAMPDALGSLIGWGGALQGVTIRNNVLVGGRTGLRLNSGDSNVTITDNISAGLLVSKGTPDDWRLAGNEWTQLTFQQEKSTKVSGSLAAATANVRKLEGELPRICAVVRRRSLPDEAAKDAADDTAGAVGATLKCP